MTKNQLKIVIQLAKIAVANETAKAPNKRDPDFRKITLTSAIEAIDAAQADLEDK